MIPPESPLPTDLARAQELFALQGRPAQFFLTTTSTNDIARQWASNGLAQRDASPAPHGSVVVADAQTLGRGRQGRNWSSPPGETIALSVILRPNVSPSRLSSLSIIAGLAVRDAIALRLPEVLLKWPNDVVVATNSGTSAAPPRSYKKLAGILVESSLVGNRVDFAVVGIGINVARASFPPELRETATSILHERGRERRDAGAAGSSPIIDLVDLIDRASLITDVVSALESECKAWLDDGYKLDQRAARWDVLLGARVRLSSGALGVADGIDSQGRLRVRVDAEARSTIVFACAGEVHPA